MAHWNTDTCAIKIMPLPLDLYHYLYIKKSSGIFIYVCSSTTLLIDASFKLVSCRYHQSIFWQIFEFEDFFQALQHVIKWDCLTQMGNKLLMWCWSSEEISCSWFRNRVFRAYDPCNKSLSVYFCKVWGKKKINCSEKA